MTLRRVVACLAIAGGAMVVVPLSPAKADGPIINWLPDAACNQGTANAQVSNPNPFNPHTPHSHPGTDCMTMPGLKGPNN